MKRLLAQVQWAYSLNRTLSDAEGWIISWMIAVLGAGCIMAGGGWGTMLLAIVLLVAILEAVVLPLRAVYRFHASASSYLNAREQEIALTAARPTCSWPSGFTVHRVKELGGVELNRLPHLQHRVKVSSLSLSLSGKQTVTLPLVEGQ